MGETHNERERRRREAMEWWNTEVQLSSFARHLTDDARIVASNPALRFASEADAEADRWRRVTKIFGPEAAQALRIDLLLAGQPLFDREGRAPAGGQQEAAVITPSALDQESERSPLPRPASRPVGPVGPTAPQPAGIDWGQPETTMAPLKTGNAPIDWHRVNRDNMSPLLDATAVPPGPPAGAVGWFQERADRLGVTLSAGIGMLVVTVSCVAAVLFAIL